MNGLGLVLITVLTPLLAWVLVMLWDDHRKKSKSKMLRDFDEDGLCDLTEE